MIHLGRIVYYFGFFSMIAGLAFFAGVLAAGLVILVTKL